MEIYCTLRIYEVAGEEVPVAQWDTVLLSVLSHESSSNLVVLKFGKTNIAVHASELVSAVQKCIKP